MWRMVGDQTTYNAFRFPLFHVSPHFPLSTAHFARPLPTVPLHFPHLALALAWGLALGHRSRTQEHHTAANGVASKYTSGTHHPVNH